MEGDNLLILTYEMAARNFMRDLNGNRGAAFRRKESVV